jgi:hypothetical protein
MKEDSNNYHIITNHNYLELKMAELEGYERIEAFVSSLIASRMVLLMFPL